MITGNIFLAKDTTDEVGDALKLSKRDEPHERDRTRICHGFRITSFIIEAVVGRTD